MANALRAEDVYKYMKEHIFVLGKVYKNLLDEPDSETNELIKKTTERAKRQPNGKKSSFTTSPMKAGKHLIILNFFVINSKVIIYQI